MPQVVLASNIIGRKKNLRKKPAKKNLHGPHARTSENHSHARLVHQIPSSPPSHQAAADPCANPSLRRRHQHRDGRGLHTRHHHPSRSDRRRGRIHPVVRRHLPPDPAVVKDLSIQQRAVIPILTVRGVIAQAQSGAGKTSMISLCLPSYRDQCPRGAGISDDMDRGFTDRKNLLMDHRTMAPKIDDLRSQPCL